MKVKNESEVTQSCLTFHDPWTAAHQAPPPMGVSSKSTGVGNLCLPSSIPVNLGSSLVIYFNEPPKQITYKKEGGKILYIFFF